MRLQPANDPDMQIYTHLGIYPANYIFLAEIQTLSALLLFFIFATNDHEIGLVAFICLKI